MPEKRLDRIERKLDQLADGMTTFAVKVDEKFERMDQRMATLEQKMDAGYDRLDRKMDAGFQRLDHKMDAGFKRLSDWLRSIETTQTAINGELSDKV
jgi:DNA anti-recombination protein RmuC